MKPQMKRPAKSLLCSLLAGTLAIASLSASAWADSAADIKAGEAASKTCVGCHGPHGNSMTPAFPSLAGQPARYIAEQLHAFHDGKRVNIIMNMQAKVLTDQQIADLAAYFAAQKRVVKQPAKKDSISGAHLYRFGRGTAGVAACAACHGPGGHGNQPAGFPQLRGLTPAYITQSLQDYRSGKRATDRDQIMRHIAGKLSDEDIAALAQHIATFH